MVVPAPSESGTERAVEHQVEIDEQYETPGLGPVVGRPSELDSSGLDLLDGAGAAAAALARGRVRLTRAQVGGTVAEQQLRVSGQLGPGDVGRRVQRLGQREGGHGVIVSCPVVPNRRARGVRYPILGG